MGMATPGSLLREARLRHGLTQGDLAIRARKAQVVIADIESNRFSPTVEMLRELLELVGEDLVLDVKKWETGIDITLNQGNLELIAEHRVQRGLVFADLVRRIRPGGSGDLGRSVQIGPLLKALDDNRVDFVVIGSIAGLAHGSAYPTYDLDVAYAGRSENLNNLVMALEEIGFQISGEDLVAQDALSLDTQFGTLDVIRRVPGIETYKQLQRDSSRELLGGVVVDVASLNHLIAMKRAAGRRKDRLLAMEYVELANEIHRQKEES
jgi:transcriptional regulator with XRE-family HTH domain